MPVTAVRTVEAMSSVVRPSRDAWVRSRSTITSGLATSKSLASETRPGMSSIRDWMRSAMAPRVAKSSPEISISSGLPTGGPSSGRRTSMSAPGMPSHCLRTQSMVANELWLRSSRSMRSRVIRPWVTSPREPPPNSAWLPAPADAAMVFKSGVPVRRRSISWITSLVRSTRVPGGMSTSTKICRGSVSGKNSTPWLNRPNRMTMPTKAATVAPITSRR